MDIAGIVKGASEGAGLGNKVGTCVVDAHSQYFMIECTVFGEYSKHGCGDSRCAMLQERRCDSCGWNCRPTEGC